MSTKVGLQRPPEDPDPSAKNDIVETDAVPLWLLKKQDWVQISFRLVQPWLASPTSLMSM